MAAPIFARIPRALRHSVTNLLARVFYCLTDSPARLSKFLLYLAFKPVSSTFVFKVAVPRKSSQFFFRRAFHLFSFAFDFVFVLHLRPLLCDRNSHLTNCHPLIRT
jgi:hypothetical protein